MEQDMFKRIPVREQDPQVRSSNFEEVCLGYNAEEAAAEAARCLNCKKPGCVSGCPVSINIPGFINEIKNNNIEGAYSIISESSSLPAVCGRVCPQEKQCESKCVRGIKGDAVAIGKLERYVADNCPKTIPAKPEPKGKKVAVVGSGPAGLTCAGDLAKMGYEVTVFEALHKAGGVLVYGIPEFRLPKERVVAREIENIRALGVEIITDCIIGRSATIDDLLDKEGYDAVFIGSGAGLPRFMGIPGEQALGVFTANEYLTRSNLMGAFSKDSRTPIMRPKKAVVVGGGNVAMDAARTAKRLGADVTVVYRRGAEELPARAEEVNNAEEENIHFEFLTNPVQIKVNDKGWVTGITCIRMQLGETDESGRARPEPVEGSDFTIDCDCVIMALGTRPNPLISQTTEGMDFTRKGTLEVDYDFQTSRPGVFAGGDAVTGAATVILAMGAGKKAAEGIDKYLSES